MKLRPQKLAAGPTALTVDDVDWARQDPSLLRWMAQLLVLVRRFEETVLELKEQGLVHGPVRSSVGGEAAAVGTALALAPADRVAGNDGAHHHYLARMLAGLAPEGFDPVASQLPAAVREATGAVLAEIMGLAGGCCGGRGGPGHLADKAATAMVGGGIPAAAGAAWADKLQARDAVTVCFLDDGGCSPGALAEAALLAVRWKLPVIFAVETGREAAPGRGRSAVAGAPSPGGPGSRLRDAAAASSLPILAADGRDPLAVMLAVREALGRREPAGTDPPAWLPCLLELDTRRSRQDPIAHCGDRLWRIGALDEAGGARLRESAERCVAEAVAACTEERSGKLVVPERLWPAGGTLHAGVRHNRVSIRAVGVEQEQWPRGAPTADERTASATPDREVRYSDAIAGVSARWLQKDDRVVVIRGETDAGDADWPAAGVTGGEANGRTVAAPVSAGALAGMACGAALAGLRPVVELMVPSRCLDAADQLLNQAGQLGYLYGGRPLPLVVRTRVLTGLGYGAGACLDPAALFSLFPGWRVVAPSTPFDYTGLFNAAMAADSPTLIIEHQGLYDRTGMVPSGHPDHVVAYGKAKVVREGSDVTVVAYSFAVSQALEAAGRLASAGIQAEVIDLRSLDPAGTDYAAIGRSLERTGALAVIEQAPACASLGPRIAAECQRRFFDSFDCPPVLVAGADVPMPVSRRLEEACIPTIDAITDAIRRAAKRAR